MKLDKILIAGYKGMVGSAIVRAFKNNGYENLVLIDRQELDLLCQNEVKLFLEKNKPDAIIIAAAKVGGIVANNIYRADFLYQNLMIEANLIHYAHTVGVKKLIFLGSSCIYPKFSSQPIREECLLSGFLEDTNEPYAIAKIAGIKLCESYYRQYGSNFYSLMPTNLYGFNDNFDLNNSHVLPALIRKFHEAKISGLNEVVVWGTGTPMREFMYVDDLAKAIHHFYENIDAKDIYSLGISQINVGVGKDITIKDLATMVSDVVGFTGRISFDVEKPDGTPKKLLDVSRLNSFGYFASTELREGIIKTYDWYKENYAVREKI